MRFAIGCAALGLIALAGCASAPNTAKSNAAAATPVTADTQQVAAALVKPKTNCITGTKICSKDQQVDPSVQGMSGDALGDAQRGHPIGYAAQPPR